MRVIGFRSDTTVIVQMEYAELHMHSGATGSDFSSKFGFQHLNCGRPVNEPGRNELQTKDIPVCDVFKSAHETLEAYDELRKDLQSATTRMQKLTEKMVDLKPKKENLTGKN